MYTDKNICDLYLSKKKINTIHKITKKSVGQIIKILSDNNIKLDFHKPIPDHIGQKIIKLYEGGAGYQQIQRELKNEFVISQENIFKFLRQNKIKIHTSTKYLVNVDFLKEINHENAHFLGLMFSDGWLNSNVSIHLGLAEEDYDVLENLKNITKSEYPIYLTKSKGSKVKLPNGSVVKRKQSIYRFTIQNKEVVQDIIKLGLHSRKSWSDFGLPSIPKEFMNSFILGYFEGDGWLTICNNLRKKATWGIIGQEKFIYELRDFFQNELQLKLSVNKIKKRKESHSQLYTITTTKLSNLIKIYKWLYKDSSFVMIRKHKKWADIINNIKTSPRKYEECDLYTFNDKGVRINS